MGLAEDFAAFKKDHEQRAEDLKKSGDATTAAVEGLVGLVDKLVSRVETAPPKETSRTDEPTDVKKVVSDLGELADTVDKFVGTIDGRLSAIAKSIETLGEGDSAQTGDDKIQKSNGSPLAGLLS